MITVFKEGEDLVVKHLYTNEENVNYLQISRDDAKSLLNQLKNYLERTDYTEVLEQV